jgi:YMGG-like Gly-zipper
MGAKNMRRRHHKLRIAIFASLPLLAGISISGCATNAKTGTLIGAAVGAAAGQWIGDDTEGTLIGAGVGAGAGYMIGNEKDKEQSRQYGSSPRPK